MSTYRKETSEDGTEITFFDVNGNDLLTARWDGTYYQAKANDCSGFPTLELWSLHACEKFAALIDRHLVDTGH